MSSAVSGSSRISSRGLADQRLGDRDALALTAGQLRQPALGELGAVDGCQDLLDAAALCSAVARPKPQRLPVNPSSTASQARIALPAAAA